LKTIVHKWQNFALIRSHWCWSKFLFKTAACSKIQK
jgi:hypothetical protein